MKVIELVIVSMVVAYSPLGWATERSAWKIGPGFYLPVDLKHMDSRYLAFGDKNSNYGNKCHLANDYNRDIGSKVYSVYEGTVSKANGSVGNYGGDTPAKRGGAIVIKHKIPNGGGYFYALYGHVLIIGVLLILNHF